MNWQNIAGIPESQAISIAARIHSVLSSWLKTPYSESGSKKGAGINCVRWVCAVADELYGYSRGPLENLPVDRCLHDPHGARNVMRSIRRRYMPLSNLAPDDALEPGDILVVGPAKGGPGHAMMVGGIEGHVWHCIRDTGVVQTCMPEFSGKQKLFRVYRVRNKLLWHR